MKRLCSVLIIGYALTLLGMAIAQQVNYPPSVTGLQARFFGTPAGATTTYYYWVQATYCCGRSDIAGPIAITPPGTPSPDNRVLIQWNAAPTGISYNIFKTTVNTKPTGACNCSLAVEQTSNAINDTGQALQTYTVKNTPGSIQNN